MALIAVFSAGFLLFRHLKKKPAEVTSELEEKSAE
jgi:hypothetical protein